MAVKQAMPGGPAGESLPAGLARGAPPGRALRKLWPFGGLILLAGRLPAGPARGEPARGGDPARLPAGPARGEPAGGVFQRACQRV